MLRIRILLPQIISSGERSDAANHFILTATW